MRMVLHGIVCGGDENNRKYNVGGMVGESIPEVI